MAYNQSLPNNLTQKCFSVAKNVSYQSTLDKKRSNSSYVKTTLKVLTRSQDMEFLRTMFALFQMLSNQWGRYQHSLILLSLLIFDNNCLHKTDIKSIPCKLYCYKAQGGRQTGDSKDERTVTWPCITWPPTS